MPLKAGPAAHHPGAWPRPGVLQPRASHPLVKALPPVPGEGASPKGRAGRAQAWDPNRKRCSDRVPTVGERGGHRGTGSRRDWQLLCNPGGTGRSQLAHVKNSGGAGLSLPPPPPCPLPLPSTRPSSSGCSLSGSRSPFGSRASTSEPGQGPQPGAGRSAHPRGPRTRGESRPRGREGGARGAPRRRRNGAKVSWAALKGAAAFAGGEGAGEPGGAAWELGGREAGGGGGRGPPEASLESQVLGREGGGAFSVPHPPPPPAILESASGPPWPRS